MNKSIVGRAWNRVERQFGNSCRILLWIACIATSGLCSAADHAEHSSSHASDKAKVWKAAISRKPQAVSVALDGKGGLWKAYVQGGHVLVSHSDNHGKSYTPPVAVNTEPELVAAIGENRPKIVVDRNGGIHVSYTQNLEAPFAGHIRYSRSLDSGKTFSPPITVNDNLDPITHGFNAMAVNERSQIYIAWIDKRDSIIAKKKGEKYQGAAIYYAISEDGGNTFHKNIKVADHSCECCRVAMSMDSDGIPVIVWRNIFGNNIRDHAMMRLDGNLRPVRLSSENWEADACPHHGPAVSIAKDGIYHFVWFSNAPGRHGLFYANSSDQGKHFSSPVNFGHFQSQASHPDVLSLNQHVYVAWKEFDGQVTGVYLMHSSDGGKSWSAPQHIASTGDTSDYPLLAGYGSQPYLAWNTAAEGFRFIRLAGGVQ